MLPNTDKEGVTKVANAISTNVRELDLEATLGIDASITVSIGVVMLCCDSHDTPVSMIESADDLLFQAKANGRDCIVFADPIEDNIPVVKGSS